MSFSRKPKDKDYALPLPIVNKHESKKEGKDMETALMDSSKMKGPARTTKESHKLVIFPHDTDSASNVILPEYEIYSDEEGEILKDVEIRRVTAYCTADSYKFKELNAYITNKRSDNFSNPKKYDEVLYTCYFRNKADKAKILDDKDGSILTDAVASSSPVGEIFFFDYGVIVIWGLDEADEKSLLREIIPFEADKLDISDVEIESFKFCHNPGHSPRLFNDIINLKSGHYMVKMTGESFSDMTGSYHWTPERDKFLIQAVETVKKTKRPKKKGDKTPKWELIAHEYNLLSRSDACAETVRNRFNKMQKEKQETKLLMNTSGMGIDMSTIDPVVQKEFLAAHPNEIIGQVKKFLNYDENKKEYIDAASILTDIGSNQFIDSEKEGHLLFTLELLMKNVSKCEEKTFAVAKISNEPKKPNQLSVFEKEVLEFMKKETNNGEKEFTMYEQSVQILNQMNLNETEYLKAIDILQEKGNSQKFIVIPEDKRLPFLLNKMNLH